MATYCWLKSSSNFGYRTIMLQTAEKAVLSAGIRATPPAPKAPAKRPELLPLLLPQPERLRKALSTHSHFRITEVLPPPTRSQHGCAPASGWQFSPSISSSWPCAVDVCLQKAVAGRKPSHIRQLPSALPFLSLSLISY